MFLTQPIEENLVKSKYLSFGKDFELNEITPKEETRIQLPTYAKTLQVLDI